MKEVTCNKCGWVHMAISKYSSESTNDKCFNCGNSYKDFRPAVDADAPVGVTLQPILEYVDMREEVIKRMRSNEALEEDLDIANKRITELEYHISESIRLLEKSEHPFYLGISMLKDSIK